MMSPESPLPMSLASLGEGEAEPFGLSWPGKADAMRASRTPVTGTLLPLREVSVGFDTAPHLLVEGDNLDVLKLLQQGYRGAIQLIFIDPPYNTGKDFIYADNFRESRRDYVAAQAVLSANPETGGRFHSRWLSMLYPRLLLARELLREEGFLVVAIDDHEVHHLRLVLDELFGAEQFIANVVWQKKYTRSNDARFFSATHDHLLVYARRREAAHLNLLPRDEAQTRAYANPDADPRGPWKATPLHAKSGRGAGFTHTFSNGVRWSPPPGTYPRFSAETLAGLEANGEIWFGADGTAVPSRKSFLSEVKDGVTPVTLWPYQEVGHTHEANEELKVLLGECVFDNPKPTRLVRRFLTLMTDPQGGDVVLDFFAGSGTTGHAVLLQNAEDGGNRRFILVQLPEPTGRADYPTIADITRARVSKALQALKPCSTSTPLGVEAAGPPAGGGRKKIARQGVGGQSSSEAQGGLVETVMENQVKTALETQAETVMENQAETVNRTSQGGPEGQTFMSPLPGGPAASTPRGDDVEQGYRAFRLAGSCFSPWPGTPSSPDELEARLRAHISPLRPDRSEEDILFELLLKAGLPLTTTLERLTPQTYRAAHLLVSLQPTLTEPDLQALFDHQPQHLIVLDSALTDSLKTLARLQGIPLTTV